MATAALAPLDTFVSKSPSLVRVLTVDEHPLIGEGLGALIRNCDEMDVVAHAHTASEAISACLRHLPNIVTLDPQLSDMSGEVAVRRILQECPGTRIVMITDARCDVRLDRALEAGVHGFVLKGKEREDLVDTIRLVHRGRRHIPGQIATILAEHLGDESLTPREVEVLGLVAQGNRNKQVAALLSIADETVRMHMKNILGKLCANDRTHAVTIALARGILAI